MCAGASVFEALMAANTSSTNRVGVVGIGGLGTMAISMARAMGCAITAITHGGIRGGDSTGDAIEMGADEVRALDDIKGCGRPDSDGGIKAHQHPQPMNINVLLITSTEVPELGPLMPLLARRATIVLMTIQQTALTVPYMQFLLPGHRLIASTEASRENHINMLEFAARHKIRPWVQQFPMTVDGVTQAFERLETGKMRYRAVLVREDHTISS